MTPFQIDKLQLGYIVQQEREAEAAEAAGAGTDYSEDRKRQHRQNIRQRLKQQ